MHFFYLDESGCTGADLLAAQQPIFVLGGLSVKDEGWVETTRQFNGVIGGYFGGAPPDGFELHASELLSPNGEGVFAGHDRLRRNALARAILELIVTRKHGIHYCAINKRKLNDEPVCGRTDLFDAKIPYLLAYNYMVTYIEEYVKKKLGKTARGMVILDEKKEDFDSVGRITHERRFHATNARRLKWLVEFSYPIDSVRHPMVQISDLIIFCVRKFLEVDLGFHDEWPSEAKRFFAECFSIIVGRVEWAKVVEQAGRENRALNDLLEVVRAAPRRNWRATYGVPA